MLAPLLYRQLNAGFEVKKLAFVAGNHQFNTGKFQDGTEI